MSQKQIHILHFEDDEGQALLTKESLEIAGYPVESALTGKQGLDLLQKRFFDVVLIDQELSDMKGLEIYERIRAISPDTVCIMVTGSGDEVLATMAMKAGLHDYIVKAANAAHLATLPLVVERALEHQKLRKEKEQYAANLEQRVAERTRELEEKNRTLERYQLFTEGRELDMRQLKEEVNALLEQVGKPKKY